MSDENLKSPFWWFLEISISLTMFLFYIDEGYYDFRWMKDTGNWIVFLIYVLALIIAQLIIDQTVRRIFKRTNLSPLSAIIGLVGGLFFLFWMLG